MYNEAEESIKNAYQKCLKMSGDFYLSFLLFSSNARVTFIVSLLRRIE